MDKRFFLLGFFLAIQTDRASAGIYDIHRKVRVFVDKNDKLDSASKCLRDCANETRICFDAILGALKAGYVGTIQGFFDSSYENHVPVHSVYFKGKVISWNSFRNIWLNGQSDLTELFLSYAQQDILNKVQKAYDVLRQNNRKALKKELSKPLYEQLVWLRNEASLSGREIERILDIVYKKTRTDGASLKHRGKLFVEAQPTPEKYADDREASFDLSAWVLDSLLARLPLSGQEPYAPRTVMAFCSQKGDPNFMTAQGMDPEEQKNFFDDYFQNHLKMKSQKTKAEKEICEEIKRHFLDQAAEIITTRLRTVLDGLLSSKNSEDLSKEIDYLQAFHSQHQTPNTIFHIESFIQWLRQEVGLRPSEVGKLLNLPDQEEYQAAPALPGTIDHPEKQEIEDYGLSSEKDTSYAQEKPSLPEQRLVEVVQEADAQEDDNQTPHEDKKDVQAEGSEKADGDAVVQLATVQDHEPFHGGYSVTLGGHVSENISENTGSLHDELNQETLETGSVFFGIQEREKEGDLQKQEEGSEPAKDETLIEQNHDVFHFNIETTLESRLDTATGYQVFNRREEAPSLSFTDAEIVKNIDTTTVEFSVVSQNIELLAQEKEMAPALTTDAVQESDSKADPVLEGAGKEGNFDGPPKTEGLETELEGQPIQAALIENTDEKDGLVAKAEGLETELEGPETVAQNQDTSGHLHQEKAQTEAFVPQQETSLEETK